MALSDLEKMWNKFDECFAEREYEASVKESRVNENEDIKNQVVQEAFHVYLNKFEIVVTHLFFVILCNVDLHKLV